MTEQHKRVLVVDDDAETRNLLKTVLSRRMLTVDVAAGGQEALDLIQQNSYSVVLLDLMMPVVDGYTVLQRLSDPAMPSPVVLVVTGADRATIDRVRGAQLVHGIVRKPFDPEELASLVLACTEIKGRTFGPMAIATVIAGGSWFTLLG